jgi:hypothetical protein
VGWWVAGHPTLKAYPALTFPVVGFHQVALQMDHKAFHRVYHRVVRRETFHQEVLCLAVMEELLFPGVMQVVQLDWVEDPCFKVPKTHPCKLLLKPGSALKPARSIPFFWMF